MNEVTTNNTPDEKEPATGFAVITYVHGVTEPIKKILNSHHVYVAQKPFQTLGHIFAKPKDLITNEQLADGFYSIPCNGCDHKYIGQTKRHFGTRLKEHQRAVSSCEKENSALSQHTCLINHQLGGTILKLSPLVDVTTSAFVWKPCISTLPTLR